MVISVLAIAFWSGLAAVSSVVAAVAALTTIFYARATVFDARSARRESQAQQEDLLGEQRRTVAATEIAQQEAHQAAEDARRAYERERLEATRLLAAQERLRRIDQLERISQLLGVLANTARDELLAPPPTLPFSPLPLTRLPTVLAELRAAVALHSALGGVEIEALRDLAVNPYSAGHEPAVFLGRAQACLEQVALLVETNPGDKAGATTT